MEIKGKITIGSQEEYENSGYQKLVFDVIVEYFNKRNDANLQPIFDDPDCEVLEEYFGVDIRKLCDLHEFILEGYSDYKEKIYSYDIVTTYQAKYGDFIFETETAAYRKDQSVCDEEWTEEITIIHTPTLNKEKADAKKNSNQTNRENWKNLIEKTSTDEFLTILEDIKFPKKLLKKG